MSVRMRLPVGFLTAEGGLVRYEDLVGEVVAEHDLGGAAPPDRTSATHRLRQVLYESVDDPRFTVHTLLEQRDRRHTVIGRLERFADLSEVMLRYPELATSAGYLLTPHIREWEKEESASSEREVPPLGDARARRKGVD